MDVQCRPGCENDGCRGWMVRMPGKAGKGRLSFLLDGSGPVRRVLLGVDILCQAGQ